jgi:hypothetical protein
MMVSQIKIRGVPDSLRREFFLTIYKQDSEVLLQEYIKEMESNP